MSDLDPASLAPTRFSAEQYLALVASGVLAEDDPVELLAGVIVHVPPQSPLHASSVARLMSTLFERVGDRAAVRARCPLVIAPASVPEPDLAVVPGSHDDYRDAHPTTALLVVEVADLSLPQDRLSKSRIYAVSGIPEYWILNLRDGVLEVMRDPDPATGVYRAVHTLVAGDTVELTALPGASVAVAELIPQPR